MTEPSRKANPKGQEESELQWFPCIHYLIQFDQLLVEAFINSSSEVHAVQPSFGKKLGIRICKTDVSAQKIDSSRLETFGMVIALFQVDDKDKTPRFFE